MVNINVPCGLLMATLDPSNLDKRKKKQPSSASKFLSNRVYRGGCKSAANANCLKVSSGAHASYARCALFPNVSNRSALVYLREFWFCLDF